MSSDLWPLLGCGVGLRTQHYALVASQLPPMDWFEATTENFMDSGGRPIQILEKVRSHYPVALHGVSLSIGSADSLDPQYLARLRSLVERIDPFIVSDHLCWSGVDHENLHDLLPLPFTEEAIRYVVSRIQKVQEFIGRRMLIENVSTYVTYKNSTMPEWDFLTQTARRAGCGILLDLNNIYVNSKNHGFDAYEYLAHISGDLVAQFHLAGHTNMGTFLFDTHGGEIIDPVWDLYRKALSLYGRVNTLVEWDEAVPEFSRLSQECEKARSIYLKYPEKKETPVFQDLKINPLEEISSSILEAQRAIKSVIRPNTQASKTKAENWLNIAGEERIQAYAGGYVARMHEALLETYPAVKHLVGPEAFMELVEDHAELYPSHDYNLNHAGKYLEELLKKHSLSKKLGFLPDLAKLEWRVCEAFHAFEEAPFDAVQAASLASEEWEKMCVIFQPSVAVISSEWPILDLWNARHTPLKEINIDVVNRPQSVLIFRSGVEVQCPVVDKYQARLVKELLLGHTLGEACGEMAEDMGEEEAPAVAQWFSYWAKKGLICRLEHSKTGHLSTVR